MSPQMGIITAIDVAAAIAIHAAIADAHHAQVHGPADHIDRTRELFIPATETYVQLGSIGGYGYFSCASGGANVDQPLFYPTIKVPDDFVSFTSVKAVWSCPTAVANMYWRMKAHYAKVGEVTNQHSEDPGIGVTATAGANLFNVQEPANPLTLADLAIGDYLGIRVERIGSNALDTLDATVYFYGVLFTYLANQ